MNQKYYVVIIQNNNTQAVYSYDSQDDALAMYHTELGYRDVSRISTMCMVIDGKGNMIMKGYYRMDGNYD